MCWSADWDRFRTIPAFRRGKKHFAPRVGFAYRVSNKTVVRGGYGITIDPQGPAAQMLFSYPLVVLQTFSGNTAYIPFGPIANGIPPIPYPNISSGTVPLPLAVSTISLPGGDYKRGYIQSFNLALQRELPHSFVGSLAYVGTHTLHENLLFNINAASPGAGNSGRPLAVTSGRTVDQTFIQPLGIAVYNALQAQLDRSFSNGVQVKASYTFSKAIDNVDNELGSLLFYDAANFARNRALAGFDRTHNFRLAWVAELPFGAGKHWAHDGAVQQDPGGLAGKWNLQRVQRHPVYRHRVECLFERPRRNPDCGPGEGLGVQTRGHRIEFAILRSVGLCRRDAGPLRQYGPQHSSRPPAGQSGRLDLPQLSLQGALERATARRIVQHLEHPAFQQSERQYLVGWIHDHYERAQPGE